MARRGRSPKKKKQISINAYTSASKASSSTSSSARKKSKNDINNGMILCANHDKLFHRFLLSFDNAKVVLSKKIQNSNNVKFTI